MLSHGRMKRDGLYYLGLAIYCLSLNLQYSYAYNLWSVSGSGMVKVLQLMRYGAYLLCLLRFLSTRKLTPALLFFTAAMLLAALYAAVTGSDRSPIFHFLVLFCGMGVDFKRCVKLFFGIQLVTFGFYLLSAALGLWGSGYDLSQPGRKRYYLGYGWVNRASYCWFFITLELLYLKKGRLRPLLMAGLAGMNLAIFLLTNTAFSMLMTFFTLALSAAYQLERLALRRRRLPDKRRLGRVLVLLFLVTVLIGVGLPFVFTWASPLMQRLNRLTNFRLSLGQTAIRRYGVHLGGNKLTWVGSSSLLLGIGDATEYFYVDSGFLQFALSYGLLFTGFLVLIYLYSLKKAAEKGEYSLAVCLMILSVLFIFEPYVVDFAYNPFVFYFVSLLTPDFLSRFVRWRGRLPAARSDPPKAGKEQML